MIPCVLYAAKSTEDKHGSIPTQIDDCEALAEREGWQVVDKFSDEAASAFKGNRGPDLAQAMAQAEHLAGEHGECALLVQHSDRLARGDGRQSKHLVEYALWALKAGVTIRSVQDPQTFSDLLYAVVTGQRNHEDSKRKGMATAAGHRRRFESGRRLGSPIPDGFKLDPVVGEDGKAIVARDGRAVRECVVDPDRTPIWLRIFELIEAGNTPGDVARTLNAEGVTTGRAGNWTRKHIRRGVLNDWYCGRAHAYGQTIEADHPALIEPERWERIAALVAGNDPVSTRARAGGRPAKTNAADYLLRGIASCGSCGQSLYTRRLASGRAYRCRGAREAQGTCDAPYIPAQEAEEAVVRHLDEFVGDVEAWLAEDAAKGADERTRFAEALEGQRRELRRLDLRVQRAREQYGRLLDRDEDALADSALAEAGRFEAERDHLGEALVAGEQRLADWPAAPEVDVLLDFYGELRDVIQGRLEGAQAVRDLNVALRSILAEAALSYDGQRLSGRFQLRISTDVLAGRAPRALTVDGTMSSAEYEPTAEAVLGALRRSREARAEPVTTSS